MSKDLHKPNSVSESDLSINLVHEFDLDGISKSAIQSLLQYCFEDYPLDRTYINSIPHFRILLHHDGIVLGHCGCHFRLVSDGIRLIEVIGIADLCIHPTIQHLGHGASILKFIKDRCNSSSAEYIVCFSAENIFYEKNGFILHDLACKWLCLLDGKTLGIIHRKLANMIYIFPLGKTPQWSGKHLDLIGPVF